MLLATPSAHAAWPAAVIGMSPIRKVGALPRRARREQSERAVRGNEHVAAL